MSISVRDGVPGSGKSYTAVTHDILPALKRGRMVVTNIPMNRKNVEAYLKTSIDETLIVLENKWEKHTDSRGIESEQEVRGFSRLEHWTEYETWINQEEKYKGEGPLYVIDECHEVIHLEEMSAPDMKALADWFAVHRKKGIDIVLVTQCMEEIPPKYRRRVEARYRYRQLNTFGLSSRFVEIFTQGESKTPIGRRFGKYDSKIFPLYQSIEEGRMSTAGTSIKSIWKSPKVIVVFLAIVSAFTYIISAGFTLTPDWGGREEKALATEQQPQQTQVKTATNEPEQQILDITSGATNQINTFGRPKSQEQPQRKRQIVYDHALQQVSLKISSTLNFSGDVTYYFEGERRGRKYAFDENWFETNGYSLIEIDSCTVFIHRPGYEGWTVGCRSLITIDPESIG